MMDWASANLDYLLFVTATVVGWVVVQFLLRGVAGQRRWRLTGIALAGVALTLGGVLVNSADRREREHLRRMVEGFAPTYAQELERMGHALITIDTPPDDPRYLALIDAEVRWLAMNPAVADIYTMRKSPDGGMHFVVDSETDYDHNGAIEGEREERTAIGEPYDGVDAGMELAAEGEASFDDVAIEDRWGTWVSSYTPIRDAAENVEAILGVDYPAEEWTKSIRLARLRTIGYLTVFVITVISGTTIVTIIRAQLDERTLATQALSRQAEELHAANAKLERQQEHLIEARAQAVAAAEAKSAFLAQMSHELRTPLTAIIGYAEVLCESPQVAALPSELGDAIGSMRRNGEHLLGVINDILDFSKIDAGKMHIERVPRSPISVADEAAAVVQRLAAAKGIGLETVFEGRFPALVHVDPVRVRQILINLLNNAIKFTDAGGVRLTVRFEETDKPLLCFDVQDTGAGMDEEQAGKLFQSFVQVDQSMTRRAGGTGLGLMISKRLAQLMGGDVVLVRSVPGEGTCFQATVSVGDVAGQRMLTAGEFSARTSAVGRTTTVADLKDVEILLAEDGPDNQRLILHILGRAGANVTVVENGRLAVDAALARKSEGREFDIVLMDMQMPVMDGYTAAFELRENGYAGAIIALTAHVMSGASDQCLNSGCDDYLPKPLDRKRTFETIAKYLPEPAAAV